jgi:MFS family permease
MTWRCAWVTYAIAHVGKSLLWTASDLLTLFLLVSVYAVDPIIAGSVFLAGLAANALADLAVGVWLERHPRHAATLAGSALVLAAASFPATVLSAPRGPWALLAAALAFRIAYAGCDVPHNALLSSLGSDPKRATWLARTRTIGTALASAIAILGASGGVAIAATPLLYAIALAALAIGSAMVPLLIAFPLLPERRTSAAGIGVPLPFLAASMIGIVALGGLAKAMMHLPDLHAAFDMTTLLALLIAGRTLSALIPVRIGATRRGFAILAGIYGAAAIVAAGFVWSAAPVMLLLLGFMLGATNLINWALLPALASGARGYGVFTMMSKVALGATGLALAGGLGRVPTFSSDALASFAATMAIACIVAGLLVQLCLTRPTPRAL